MTRKGLLLSAALGLCLAAEARAQTQTEPTQGTPAPAPAAVPSLQAPPVEPPPPSPTALPEGDDQIQFTADQLDYDNEQDVVTATGDVRLYRRSERLRADKVLWNRKSGQVVAEGNVVLVNPQGDSAYGDKVELTDTLKDGVVQNMLVVLDAGGRIAAQHGERHEDGSFTVQNAAYTPCSVSDAENCPKEPTWKVTADRVIYEPDKKRL
ncbi:organic solvent tolerance protein, partial [Staphylococcus aureus]